MSTWMILRPVWIELLVGEVGAQHQQHLGLFDRFIS